MRALDLLIYSRLLHLASATKHTAKPEIETVTTDVLVVGGGSSGTYGAIQVHDANKTVAVIERAGKLGGHADSYYGPNGSVYNVGVQIFYDIPVVIDYFARHGVPLFTAPTIDTSGTINADFSLGVAAPAANVSTTELGIAIQRYGEYLAANFSTVYPGYYLPDPVPEDLYMPWGDFMSKHGFGGIANLINTIIQPAEAWKEPALFPLKLLSLDPLRGITTGFKVTRDVNDLYRSAASILGNSVYYNSSVITLCRSKSGVEAIVRTPTGLKRFVAKKLLMATPPVSANFLGWDLSNEETELFDKFTTQQYYAGVIRHSGLPQVTVQNVGFTTPFNIPVLPALFNVVPTGFQDNTFVIYYTAHERVEPDAVKADTVATLERLAAGGVIGESETEFLELFDHPNIRMYVSAEDVRDGFYSRLYGLQGQQNTYWTGAAWVTQASSPIWDFTKSVVSELLAEL
ncbi:hypothetical protein KVR01_000237 [Diaporthe batatas]|uniref:uncharacterized protein n=1 Tax=Diaporthe batatas TaxID=748121 RepID=UPI001D0375C3|nr:uncharacterized protein KVR01_000237 [Diaporthe batatas]KAG8169492.1 hypothetical protein KVR01_000237 [Diaporthe batatas]